ncbi:MAG: hypothetical protein IJK93_00410 [Muribaculaceae bacterium]|nr:hypothetical protein [Muribaculaceae bacterium]
MELKNHNLIKSIEDEWGTPFYLMFPDRYRNNLSSFLDAFKKRYPKIIAGYSFKTNYVPGLCEIAKLMGVYAEVVSDMELDLAIKLGFENIIFNGPIKKKNSLIRAINHNAIINLDSEYEVDTVCQLKLAHPDMQMRIGLRLNVHLIDDDGNSSIQCGLKHGRFGFPKLLLSRNIERLRSAGISICSIHGHTSSCDRAVINYKVITDYMISVCEDYGLNDVEYFNIGGGFFGAAPEGMDLTGRYTYNDYANVVLDSALSSPWFTQCQPSIVIEPGSSVVSNVFEYYTKVFQLKQIGSKTFVIVDGSVFDVKPTMHQGNLPHSIIGGNNLASEIECDVVGSTCMEKDIILHDVKLPYASAGEILQIKGVGAYTISLSPSFINYLAPILSIENGSIRLIRRRQVLDDLLNIYNL